MITRKAGLASRMRRLLVSAQERGKRVREFRIRESAAVALARELLPALHQDASEEEILRWWRSPYMKSSLYGVTVVLDERVPSICLMHESDQMQT